MPHSQTLRSTFWALLSPCAMSSGFLWLCACRQCRTTITCDARRTWLSKPQPCHLVAALQRRRLHPRQAAQAFVLVRPRRQRQRELLTEHHNSYDQLARHNKLLSTEFPTCMDGGVSARRRQGLASMMWPALGMQHSRRAQPWPNSSVNIGDMSVNGMVIGKDQSLTQTPSWSLKCKPSDVARHGGVRPSLLLRKNPWPPSLLFSTTRRVPEHEVRRVARRTRLFPTSVSLGRREYTSKKIPALTSASPRMTKSEVQA